MNTKTNNNQKKSMNGHQKLEANTEKGSIAYLGCASMPICIEKDVPLAGYGIPRCAISASDELQVQAAFLNADGKTIILCVLDILAADDHLKMKIEEKLKNRKIQYDGLALHAIHTHSSLGGLLQTEEGLLRGTAYFAGSQNNEEIDRFAELVCDCIEKAAEDLHRCRFWKGTSVLNNIVSDRVHGTVLSQPVFVIEAGAETADFAAEANPAEQQPDPYASKDAFVFLACHPTVLSADNLIPSADFAGYMRSSMQKQGWRHVFFLNGACGDLSCRYTRKESSLEEAGRIGEAVACCAVSALSRKEPFFWHPFTALSYQAKLKSAPVLAKKEAAVRLDQALDALKNWDGKDLLTLRRKQIQRDAAKAACIKAEYDDGKPEREVKGFCCQAGSEYFVTVPGELFSSLAARVPENVHILGYTNGYMLYLPDRQAYENQIYEAMSSPFACGEPEKLMDVICQTIAELAKIQVI